MNTVSSNGIHVIFTDGVNISTVIQINIQINVFIKLWFDISHWYVHVFTLPILRQVQATLFLIFIIQISVVSWYFAVCDNIR